MIFVHASAGGAGHAERHPARGGEGLQDGVLLLLRGLRGVLVGAGTNIGSAGPRFNGTPAHAGDRAHS